jgi:hypothetical protein
MFYIDDDLRVRFKHFIERSAYGKPTGMTNCIIEMGYIDDNGDKKWTRVHIDTAYCSPKDQFDRAVGRKVALTKVLRNIPLAHRRKEYWDAYFRWNGGF